MVGVERSFVDEVLLKEWHMLQGLHMPSIKMLDRAAHGLERKLTNPDHL